MSNKKCKYCQKLEHLEETCWNKNDKSQRDVRNNDEKIKCYNCGKYGHMARSCLNKAYKPILKRVNFNDKARINPMSWEDMDLVKVELESAKTQLMGQKNIKKRTNYWRNYKKPEGKLIVMNN